MRLYVEASADIKVDAPLFDEEFSGMSKGFTTENSHVETPCKSR